MNKKEIDVYFSLNKKQLNICVFNNIDDSMIFFNEENIDINSISENTDFEIAIPDDLELSRVPSEAELEIIKIIDPTELRYSEVQDA